MPSGNLEPCIVQWTDDLITNQESLGQVKAEMWALALSWIDFTLVADDQNSILILGTDLNLSDFTLLQVVLGLDCNEVAGVDFGGSEPKGVACQGCSNKSLLGGEVGGSESQSVEEWVWGGSKEGLSEFSHRDFINILVKIRKIRYFCEYF